MTSSCFDAAGMTATSLQQDPAKYWSLLAALATEDPELIVSSEAAGGLSEMTQLVRALLVMGKDRPGPRFEARESRCLPS